MTTVGTFFWYELMTTDVKAAVEFYKAVVGWNATPFGGNELRYMVMNAGKTGVGGIMPLPNSQQPPAWLGYIHVDDVDKAAREAADAGGTIWHEPADIPGDVGRFAVIGDPNGAAYMIMKPNGPDGDRLDMMTPGHIGWNEYIGDNAKQAFGYYQRLYGWAEAEAVDMGEMGLYRLIEKDKLPVGGMMDRPPYIPASYWGFYFAVVGIDAARERVIANGGTLTMEPMEVPGGQWVLSARDPQGAHFGLVSDTK